MLNQFPVVQKGARILTVASLVIVTVILSASGTGNKRSSLHWPLPFDNGCTSSFGEYRATHFHGGVDFRTRQTIGWPCYAVADGRVIRIRREPHGYGRVLYLQLNDGRIAVYGHVCRFENKTLRLEDTLRKACEKAGTSFPGNIYPKDAPPVKKGDIVAYSGDLGVGAAHLHLEIRRGQDLCDPFNEGMPLPSGAGPPVLKGLYFVPESSEASVDGDFEPRFYSVTRRKSGSILHGTPSISGPVLIEAVVSDDLGTSRNTTGISSLSAILNGKSIFNMNLQCVSLSNYKQSPLLFDRENRRYRSSTYRMKCLPGLTVDGFSGRGLPSNVPEGKHNLFVRTGDRTGVTSSITTRVTIKKHKPDWNVSLPGSQFNIQKIYVRNTGLVLVLTRRSIRGVTPVSFGNLPVLSMRVKTGAKGRVTALIPFDALPDKGSELKLAGKDTGWIGAAGPGTLSSGDILLDLPEGAAAVIRGSDPEKAGIRSIAGPSLVRDGIRISFPSVKTGGGRGIYLGETFVDNWTGSPIRYGGNGTYRIRTDKTPPSWGYPVLKTIPHINVPELRIRLTDKGTGAYAKTLRLTMDGRPCYADYDFDSGQIRIDLSAMSKGLHVLKGACSDFAGNRGTLTHRTFKIE